MSKDLSSLRWLYVDFNSYFASVEQQLDPRLRDRPVIVTAADTDTTCAIAASYEARAFGIRTGTPVYEAKKLCPHLCIVGADHEKYVSFHHRIIDVVEQHLPVTSVRSIDEMACRLMRNEQSVARATAIARDIKQSVARDIGAYVRCSIGLAPNMFLAKIATDMQKPDGMTILSGDDVFARLATLALRDIPGVGHNMEKRLNRAGIHTVRDLLALDAARLQRAWGSVWGGRMYHLLRGTEWIEEKNAQKSMGHSHVLRPEWRPPDAARRVARRLMLKTAARLRRSGMTAQTAYVSLRTECGHKFSASDGCEGIQDSFTFLDMLDKLWMLIVRDMKRGMRVKKVSITLTGLGAPPAARAQGDLFTDVGTPDIDAAARDKRERISAAMDALNRKYGRDTVMPGALPVEGHKYTGSKVAFTRIPDLEEFWE